MPAGESLVGKEHEPQDEEGHPKDEVGHVVLVGKEGTQRQLHQEQRDNHDQDSAAAFGPPGERGDHGAARLSLEPEEERQGDQGEGEQEAQKPQMVAGPGKEPRPVVDLAVQDVLQEGTPQRSGPDPVAPLEIQHDRHEQDRSGDEGDEQAGEPFAQVEAGRAPLAGPTSYRPTPS